jgi:hypothetical protein
MPKVPAFAKAFAARWRIVEMDVWGDARHQLTLQLPTRPSSSTAC